MAEEKTIELRGTKRGEIIRYFSDMDGMDAGCSKFILQGWEVEIGEEGRHDIGSISFPSVKVIFRGEEALLEQAVCAFRQKFLTAGG